MLHAHTSWGKSSIQVLGPVFFHFLEGGRGPGTWIKVEPKNFLEWTVFTNHPFPKEANNKNEQARFSPRESRGQNHYEHYTRTNVTPT